MEVFKLLILIDHGRLGLIQCTNEHTGFDLMYFEGLLFVSSKNMK